MLKTKTEILIFVPQRVLSYEDKTVTGFYLGSEKKNVIQVSEKNLECLMKLPVSKNLPNDFFCAVLRTDDDDAIVGGNDTSLLQCESKQIGNNVYIYKTSLVENFDTSNADKMKEFILKNTGIVNGVKQKVLVDIDNSQQLSSDYEDLSLDNKSFLNAAVTPVLEVSCANSVSISSFSKSLLVMNYSDFTCLERFELVGGGDEDKSPREVEAIKGIERYFNDTNTH